MKQLDLEKVLNEEQLKAVKYIDSPLLVLAGAGTGKTKVITHKVAYLIREVKIPASNIMAVTFTNKAANEMKSRIEKIIGFSTNGLWIGTFHSLALRILRKEYALPGLIKNFTVIDQDDRLTLINRILKELNIDKKKYPGKVYLNLISRFKNTLSYARGKNIEDSYYKCVDVFKKYQEVCRSNNYVDFDDILAYTVRLFEEHEAILSYYKKLFKYILVDEYQDTNLLQFYFVKCLSGDSNICVVGDDDQSIYSWRGAEIKNILEFEKHFKGAYTIKLTKNYRSTQNILDISNKLISNNRFRKGKDLIASKDYQGFVEIKNFESDENETQFVVRKIKYLIDEGVEPNEIAILYRTNAQSRIFETYLTNVGIPYKVIGNLSFYSRKEIKDILAYMKVFDNPFDSESLMRSLKNPPSGIGEKTLKKIIENSVNNGCDLLTSIKILIPSLSGKQKNALYNFLELMEEIKNTSDIASIINLILKKRNYEDYIKSFEEDNVANKRIYNIYELINAAIKFSENNKDATLSDFLASISLITSSDTENYDAVNLLTVHSAKGLEFSSLFVVGLEEGLFPLYRAYDSSESLEEERRLCYVAITRAKDRLFLTWAKSRMLYGNIVENEPSPFLKELSADFRGFKKKDMFRRGDLIVHKNFGKGVIIEKKGEGETAKLRIMFKNAGTKTIIAKYINSV